MMRTRILTLLSILALGACASFEATGPSSDPALDFSVRADRTGTFSELPVVDAEGQQGSIAVNGRLATPDPCRTIAGSIDPAGTELTLRVAVRRSGSEACIGVIGQFAYDAVISGLAPGGYRLRVIHEYPQTGWPATTVLDQQLQVR
jgi:hypothetical protein